MVVVLKASPQRVLLRDVMIHGDDDDDDDDDDNDCDDDDDDDDDG